MFQQNILQGPGTGTFTTHTFEILIMLLGAFLFGLWFGWVLWSRYRQVAEKLRMDNVSLNGSISALQVDLSGMKTKLADSETERSAQAAQAQTLGWENETYRSRIVALENDMAKVQERNAQLEAELGMSFRPDTEGGIPLDVTEPLPSEPHEALPDLEEAIANAVEETFNKANLDIPELEDAITEAVTAAIEEKSASNMHVPPESEVPENTETTTSVDAERIDEPVVTVVSGSRDDLKIVEGIGPKIEELLFQAGVTTYGQLAATSVQQLKNLLADAGSRFAMHDPGTWSAQALLAANGEWENLKAYQDFLNAGKRPDK